MRIDRNDFRRAIGFVAQVLDHTHTKIQLSLEDNVIIVSAIGSIGFALYEVNVDGGIGTARTLIDGAKLGKFIDACSNLNIAATARQLKITDGRFKAAFNIDATEVVWPYETSDQWGRSLGTVDTDVIGTLGVGVASCNEDEMPGSLLCLDGDNDIQYALDRTQASSADGEFLSGSSKIILPRKSLRLLSSFETIAMRNLRLYNFSNHWLFHAEDDDGPDAVLGLRRVEHGTYPEWNEIYSAVSALPIVSQFSVAPRELEGELSKMLLLSIEEPIVHVRVLAEELEIKLEERVRAGSMRVGVSGIVTAGDTINVALKNFISHLNCCRDDTVEVTIRDRDGNKVVCISDSAYKGFFMGVVPNAVTEANTRDQGGDSAEDSGTGS